jgi:hypothetical protein
VVENFKEIAEFIQEHLIGCKFVGISSDNEVFIECEYDDEEMTNGTALRIKREFSYITKVTVVVKPSIESVKQMVDDLNKYLDETPPKKEGLLDIGSF